MRSTKWILLFFLQISSTVSDSETEETSPAISWIQTDTVSFYLELISLVYGSCDLNSEKTADIKLACSHLTNATHALRTFLAPLSDILPTTDQVNLLQKKMLQSGEIGLKMELESVGVLDQTEANLEANHREVVGALLYEVTSM